MTINDTDSYLTSLGGADPRLMDWGLCRTAYEKDSCGFGLIASLDDRASHWVLQTAISSLNRLTHRGAIATDGKTGDGCGLLIKQPTAFLRAVATEAGFELAPLFAAGLLRRNLLGRRLENRCAHVPNLADCHTVAHADASQRCLHLTRLRLLR